ncbi:hypothetical protein PGN35_000870 [Nodosilinea sp. PGN35]|uniref:hypothetical protein n=1 Tax=Nodosilinea sp. PGN35 TaxID=3020489 RepID=UPI0023B2C291|nr:hypothetical protein [Nodosilinea sp. TSF1-S3]MDF0369036.1 hypothetical protein [Nodosilinea sp. TSF1-S3]
MYYPDKIQAYLTHISETRSPVEDRLKRNILKYGLWLLAIPAIIYGAADRGWAAFSTAAVNPRDISYCLIALVLLLGWVCIGLAEDHLDSIALAEAELARADALAVESSCVAQQCYRLPYPYLCQIYHLLNVGHLESIHRFSLGNLKVIKISDFRKTEAGGQIRFKTMLDSPMNILRLWRNPSVEVELTIHSPHQIELKVPAYGQRFIHVLFSVMPLNDKEHYLSIQMFSDLQWPRELLKAVLIVAASLTLLEDLPYLHHLAKRNYDGLFSPRPRPQKTSQAKQLFYRYVDLYNNRWNSRQLQLLD